MVNSSIWLRVLWHVLWEDILWSINISAEGEIVDLPNVPLVQVFSDQKLEKLFRWWNKFELLHNSSKLFSCDMAASSSIVILQLGLNEDSFVSDLSSNCAQNCKEGILISVSEISSRL